MKVPKYETLYHEDPGATLKHKCGKRIVTLPLLSFFSFLFGFFGLFFYFLTWDNALIMMIITLLFTYNSKNYNSILEQKYDSI